MNGLIDRLRRLLGFGDLDRIKKAINGLSYEDLEKLEAWLGIEVVYEDIKYDPKKAGKTQKSKGRTWY